MNLCLKCGMSILNSVYVRCLGNPPSVPLKSETVPTEAAKPPKEKMLDLLYEASHNLRLAAAEAYAWGEPRADHQILKLSSAIDVLKIRMEELKP